MKGLVIEKANMDDPSDRKFIYLTNSKALEEKEIILAGAPCCDSAYKVLDLVDYKILFLGDEGVDDQIIVIDDIDEKDPGFFSNIGYGRIYTRGKGLYYRHNTDEREAHIRIDSQGLDLGMSVLMDYFTGDLTFQGNKDTHYTIRRVDGNEYIQYNNLSLILKGFDLEKRRELVRKCSFNAQTGVIKMDQRQRDYNYIPGTISLTTNNKDIPTITFRPEHTIMDPACKYNLKNTLGRWVAHINSEIV